MDKQMSMQVQHDMANLHQQDDIWQRVQRLEQELRDREGKILILQDELAKTREQVSESFNLQCSCGGFCQRIN